MSEKVRPSYRAPALAFTIFVVVGMAFSAGAAGAGEEVDPALLPDLRTLPPSDVSIDINREPGTRLLRFTNEIMNQGSGPVELGPKVEDCNQNGDFQDDRTAYQHIFHDTEKAESPGEFLRKTTGGDPADLFEEVKAGCSVFHPQHNHWHFEDFAKYELRPIGPGGPSEPVIGSSDKVSFCLVDSFAVKNQLPGFSSSRYYGAGLIHCSKDEVTGISIGWSDLYTAALEDQWIDIGPKGGPVTNGAYCLTSTADPSNHLVETNDLNNFRRVRVKIWNNKGRVATRRTCQVAQ